MASNKRKYRKAVKSKEKIKTKGQKNIKSKRKNKDGLPFPTGKK